MRSAVESRANRVLNLLIEAVVSALGSLILDGRNQVREVTMSAVYTLLTEDRHLAEPTRLTQICRHQMLPLLDNLATKMEACEGDGSLMEWLATWLQLITYVSGMLCSSFPLVEDADVFGAEETAEWLRAWEGLLDRLPVGLSCGNLLMLRLVVKAITEPLGKIGAQMPRAGWDLVFDKMPELLELALRITGARASGEGSQSRRVLPGHVIASVVVEQLMEVCEQPEVRRGSVSLAGELSLVSARNISKLIVLVGAVTSDFRLTSLESESPIAKGADEGEGFETRREQAMRLYKSLAQAASDRSNKHVAVDLWSEIIWSLLRHLPCLPSEGKEGRPGWCAGLTAPESFQPLALGFASPDMASESLAKLMYEEAQEQEEILRGVLETTALAMLVAMCSRYRGTPFQDWKEVAMAFVVILLVSVKLLGAPEREGDDARKVGLVRCLTGGIQAFIGEGSAGESIAQEREEAQVEAQVVQALVRHVIPCTRDVQVCLSFSAFA
jgi:hypothetical protein